jgi:hypothetical protein
VTQTYILDNSAENDTVGFKISLNLESFLGTRQNKRDQIIVAADLKAAVHNMRKTKQNKNRKPDI